MLHLGSYESWPFSWLHMLELHHRPELTIEVERHAILEIVSCCHGKSFSLSLQKVGYRKRNSTRGTTYLYPPGLPTRAAPIHRTSSRIHR